MLAFCIAWCQTEWNENGAPETKVDELQLLQHDQRKTKDVKAILSFMINSQI